MQNHTTLNGTEMARLYQNEIYDGQAWRFLKNYNRSAVKNYFKDLERKVTFFPDDYKTMLFLWTSHIQAFFLTQRAPEIPHLLSL